MKWRKKEFWELLATRRFSPWGLVHTETSFLLLYECCFIQNWCFEGLILSQSDHISKQQPCISSFSTCAPLPRWRHSPAHPPPPPVHTLSRQQQRRWLHRCVYLFLLPPSASFLLPLFALFVLLFVLCVFFSAFLTRLPGSVRAPLTGLECATALSVVSGEKNQYRGYFPLVVDKAWDHLYCAVHTVGWC